MDRMDGRDVALAKGREILNHGLHGFHGFFDRRNMEE
jgi:hypothetical protein